jgi:hypothetical protein
VFCLYQIPRQIIPHYHERKRARTLTLSGSSTSSAVESSSLLSRRPFEECASCIPRGGS